MAVVRLVGHTLLETDRRPLPYLRPLILAVSTDATDSYDLALYITAGIALVSTVLPLIVRPPEPPQEEVEAGAEAEAQA